MWGKQQEIKLFHDHGATNGHGVCVLLAPITQAGQSARIQVWSSAPCSCDHHGASAASNARPDRLPSISIGIFECFHLNCRKGHRPPNVVLRTLNRSLGTQGYEDASFIS